MATAGAYAKDKFPGATPYCYRRVLGKPGEREIDPERTSVVRRIFKEYVDGRSPHAIAAGLAADGIPLPSGGRFCHSSRSTDSSRAKRPKKVTVYQGHIQGVPIAQ